MFFDDGNHSKLNCNLFDEFICKDFLGLQTILDKQSIGLFPEQLLHVNFFISKFTFLYRIFNFKKHSYALSYLTCTKPERSDNRRCFRPLVLSPHRGSCSDQFRVKHAIAEERHSPSCNTYTEMSFPLV